ncbi:MAG: Fur family transcriptional regulator [Christensenellales bacterium]
MSSSSGYHTRQRDQILQYLIAHQHAHVTADQIATHLRGRQFSIGKATIYRYLDKLVTQGRVRKFYLEEGASACYRISMNPAAVRSISIKMWIAAL